MTSINIKTFVENNTKDVSIYTALTEAIVNWIHWIEEMWSENWGEIVVQFERSEQISMDSLPEIKAIQVVDNGIGFDSKNYEYFDEIHTLHKAEIWGKGFGRLTFLKFFENIQVDSFFQENGKFFHRKFGFVDANNIIQTPLLLEDLPERKNETKFHFKIKDKHLDKLDKWLEVISRKIFEKMFPFFVDQDYKCPRIILRDWTSEIILNDYIGNFWWIEELESKDFTLSKQISTDLVVSEDFKIRIYKVFFSASASSINLVADKRVVINEKVSRFIPEFKDWLVQVEKNEKGESVDKGFVIEAYVVSKYLNERVTHDREWFDFEKTKQQIGAFWTEEIYRKSAEIIRDAFQEEYSTRKDKKIRRIKEYARSRAPWHLPFIEEINFDEFGYGLSDDEIELELQRVKIKREIETRASLKAIIEDESKSIGEKEAELVRSITENGKSDLIHYVVNRKLILEYFKELLKRNDDWSASLEEDIHNVVYPMWNDSVDTNYEEHNLWLLDERLVFSHYIASDKKISRRGSKSSNKSNKEPDLLMFNKTVSFRWGPNESSNPITIFEFKRPKRDAYWADENPIIQIAKYLEEIKAWKHEMPEWIEKIKVTAETPAYWYVIADITDKIIDFAKQQGLVRSPDWEWYFWFLSGYWLYVEIVSYKKLLKDAELRNRIFFEKLWL